MCIEKAREAINGITGLSRPAKRGFAVLLNEIGEMKTDIADLKREFGQLNERSAAQEKQTAEMMKMLAVVYQKITQEKIDQKAAQMDMLSAAAKKKTVRWGMMAVVGLIMLSGVGLVWLVEHSRQTAEVVQSLK